MHLTTPSQLDPLFQLAKGSFLNKNAPSAAPTEDFKSLIGDLQSALCARLDRIESSLQHLHLKSSLPGQEERSPDGNGTRNVHIEIVTSPSACTTPREVQTLAGEDACAPDELDGQDGAQKGTVPQRLALRSEWMEGKPMEAVAVLSNERKHALRSTTVLETAEMEEPPKAWWIISPISRFRLFWDLTMVGLIAHDMAVVPVALAFDAGDNFITQALFWPFLLFWTMDIPLNFMTGYYSDGQVEVRRSRIARRYLLTWFSLDIFLMASSWYEVWIATDASMGYSLGRMGKGLRIARIMRAMRVLRFAKLRSVIDDFQDRVTSSHHHILAGIIKLVLTIVWLNHFIACSWWALGVSTSNGGANDSWTSHGGFESADISFQYFSSLHWSLTQFTPAGMEVSARNLPERIFSVVVLLFAMVAFSSFVSSITSAMTRWRQLHTTYDASFAMLRRYLRSHQVPMELTVRILNCVEYRLKKTKHEIQECQVEGLQYLSKPLRMELAKHIFAPALLRHPFFHRYAEIDSQAMRLVCLDAVSQISLAQEDILFTEGCRCEQMFFVTGGLLHYRRLRKSRASETEETLDPQGYMKKKTLEQGEWCCEVSLWCPWVHVGTMCAHQMSDVLAVDMATFISATSPFHLVNRFSARYASLFLEMAENQLSSGVQVSDMSIFSADALEDLVEKAYVQRGASKASVAVGSATSNASSYVSCGEAGTPPETAWSL